MTTTKANQEKVRLYCCFTPSHRILFEDWFFPSIQDDFELVVAHFEQECPSAEFYKEGWKKTTFKKVGFIIQAIKDNWDTIFIYSDVDIQFFRPFKNLIFELMGDKDIIFQNSNINVSKDNACTGFFACRGNSKTLHLWEDVKRIMLATPWSDQVSLNLIIMHHSNLKWGLLPVEFFTGGSITGKRWNPGDVLKIPQNIILHHANWTPGVENKIKQLAHVKEEVERGHQN